ncbi:MAG TPA: hypothetical protein VF777_14590 [Phycisphaerales bacterium]
MASGFAVREISGGMLAFGFYAGGGDRALCLAGVGAGGNLVWARRFAASNAIDGSAMEIDRATTGEMIVVAGRDTTPGLSGAILLSANAHDGSFAAESLYLPVSSEFSDLRYTDLCVMQNGDYFVTGSVGYASSMSTPDTDIVVARIDRASRNVVWCTVIAAAPPEGSDLASHDTGRGIVLTAEGMVAVVAGTQAPGAPPAALHLLIDPVTGAVLHHSVLSDVRVANASLVSLSTGQLLCAGGGDAAAGLSVAQMWRLDPSTLEVSWRGEYAEVESVGADAVELLDAGEPSIVLAGWQQLPGGIGLPVGLQGTMFTRADLDGHDGCAAVITTPKLSRIALHTRTMTMIQITPVPDIPFDGTIALLTVDALSGCPASACPSDLNGDGAVDDSDFVVFDTAYNLLDCDDPSMPVACPADLNFDGFVDDGDFVLFAAAYNELLCP